MVIAQLKEKLFALENMNKKNESKYRKKKYGKFMICRQEKNVLIVK